MRHHARHEAAGRRVRVHAGGETADHARRFRARNGVQPLGELDATIMAVRRPWHQFPCRRRIHHQQRPGRGGACAKPLADPAHQVALTALALSIETDRATQPDGATKAAELRTLMQQHQALRASVPPVRAEAPEPNIHTAGELIRRIDELRDRLLGGDDWCFARHVFEFSLRGELSRGFTCWGAVADWIRPRRRRSRGGSQDRQVRQRLACHPLGNPSA